MYGIVKRVEEVLAEAGFARADEAGRGAFARPGFCTRRERGLVLIGYVGSGGAVEAEEAQRHLSAYANVLLAANFQVDRVSGAYHCLKISVADAVEPPHAA